MSVPVTELEWNGDTANFYCPVCGSMLWSEDGESEPCEHIVLAFADVEIEAVGVEAIKFGSDKLQEAFYDSAEKLMNKNLETDPDGYDDVDEFLYELSCKEYRDLALSNIDSPSAFCLCFTTNGMACGPASTTITVCVVYCPNI